MIDFFVWSPLLIKLSDEQKIATANGNQPKDFQELANTALSRISLQIKTDGCTENRNATL